MNLTITDAARQQLVSILIDNKATTIRFGLQGGGCNGFSYFLKLEEVAEEDDFSVNLPSGHDGPATYTLLVDPMSASYLDGAIIEYKKDLMGETFVFSNPNIKTQCGCGNSVGF